MQQNQAPLLRPITCIYLALYSARTFSISVYAIWANECSWLLPGYPPIDNFGEGQRFEACRYECDCLLTLNSANKCATLHCLLPGSMQACMLWVHYLADATQSKSMHIYAAVAPLTHVFCCLTMVIGLAVCVGWMTQISVTAVCCWPHNRYSMMHLHTMICPTELQDITCLTYTL